MKSSRVAHAARRSRGAPRWRRTAGRPAASRSSAARWNGERRLGALVVVRRLLAEPVAAAAGREVVQRPVEPVAAEEPVERLLRAQPVLRVAGDGERGQLGLDERRRVERLLVAAAGRRLVAARGRRGRSAAASPSARPDSSPSQRSDSRPVCVRSSASERDAADDQRVREARVVVGELRPRTSASLGARGSRRRRELLDEPLEQPRASGSSRSGSRRARPSTA